MAQEQKRSSTKDSGARASGAGRASEAENKQGSDSRQQQGGRSGTRGGEQSSERATQRNRDAKLNPQDEGQVEMDIEPVSDEEFIEDVEEQEEQYDDEK